jgi:hypothetical protein
VIKKLLLLAATGALAAGGLALALPAQASSPGPTGALCQLSGNANFSPGLTATPEPYSYTFTGKLSGCQSNLPNAPTGGSISASSNGSNNGTCFEGINGAGTATVTWSGGPYGGSTSTVDYTTDAVGALVYVSGTVTKGVFEGDTVEGALVFQTSTPQDCATTTGLTSASFQGVIGTGSTS